METSTTFSNVLENFQKNRKNFAANLIYTVSAHTYVHTYVHPYVYLCSLYAKLEFQLPLNEFGIPILIEEQSDNTGTLILIGQI